MNQAKDTLTAGGAAAKSVAPSPTITTFRYEFVLFKRSITTAFPFCSDVGCSSSKPA